MNKIFNCIQYEGIPALAFTRNETRMAYIGKNCEQVLSEGLIIHKLTVTNTADTKAFKWRSTVCRASPFNIFPEMPLVTNDIIGPNTDHKHQ